MRHVVITGLAKYILSLGSFRYDSKGRCLLVFKLLNHASSRFWEWLVIYGPNLFPNLGPGYNRYFAKPALILILSSCAGLDVIAVAAAALSSFVPRNQYTLCPTSISPGIRVHPFKTTRM